MTTKQPKTIYLADYKQPSYWVESVNLCFELDETATKVYSEIQLSRNPNQSRQESVLLAGDNLTLVRCCIDDVELNADQYTLTEEGLLLSQLPERCKVTVETIINPKTNTALSGLYQAGDILCTQCEPHGFQRMTYYLDRPDVLATFRTKIIGDKAKYPTLLANGNLVEQGECDDGRHYAIWDDPFPKPSYLFALVAGELDCLSDSFVTCSGREIALKIFAEPGKAARCQYAMQGLKKSMRWDEERYGREYDLDIFMIVAVSAFNMGAMENKGLNIFNDKYIHADPQTATDNDYMGIDRVVGHEYFHNWSGNRVTCRDWFQLSLKEGFTVFREQSFMEDITEEAVKRIEGVQLLRNRQFSEDAGPLAHPVRPSSYIEINNFYTMTVYEKGAELIRMQKILLGAEKFHEACDLYFERYDGQAVTTDDFVATMEEVGQVDLSQFKRWYEQAGTPEVTVAWQYDANTQALNLDFKQSLAPTPGQAEKLPMHIPIKLGLVDEQGCELQFKLAGSREAVATTVFELTQAEQALSLQVEKPPVVSLLRGFSAPIKLHAPYTPAELSCLFGYDSDGFSRWEAGQQLAVMALRAHIAGEQEQWLQLSQQYSSAFGRILADGDLDPWLKAVLLRLPDEIYLASLFDIIPVLEIQQARRALVGVLVSDHSAVLGEVFQQYSSSADYQLTNADIAARELAHTCLLYLAELESGQALAFDYYHASQHMTAWFAALSAINHHACDKREQLFADFLQRFEHEPLVVDKWLSLQARSQLADTVERVTALLEHPVFDIRIPNRVYSLLGGFGMANPSQFHRADGAGYRLLTEQLIKLDGINPQVAARMFQPLTAWQKYDQNRRDMMHTCLIDIKNQTSSKDVYEMVEKSLGDSP